IVNGWNNVKDNNVAKSLGFMGSFKPINKVTLVTNVLWGKELATSDDARTLIDGILTFNLNDKVSFMANYDYGKERIPQDLFGFQSCPPVFLQGVAAYV